MSSDKVMVPSREKRAQLRELISELEGYAAQSDERLKDALADRNSALFKLSAIADDENEVNDRVFAKFIDLSGSEMAEKGAILSLLRTRYSKLLLSVPRVIKHFEYDLNAAMALAKDLKAENKLLRRRMEDTKTKMTSQTERLVVADDVQRKLQGQVEKLQRESQHAQEELEAYHITFKSQRERTNAITARIEKERDAWLARINFQRAAVAAEGMEASEFVPEVDVESLIARLTVVMRDASTTAAPTLTVTEVQTEEAEPVDQVDSVLSESDAEQEPEAEAEVGEVEKKKEPASPKKKPAHSRRRRRRSIRPKAKPADPDEDPTPVLSSPQPDDQPSPTVPGPRSRSRAMAGMDVPELIVTVESSRAESQRVNPVTFTPEAVAVEESTGPMRLTGDMTTVLDTTDRLEVERRRRKSVLVLRHDAETQTDVVKEVVRTRQPRAELERVGGCMPRSRGADAVLPAITQPAAVTKPETPAPIPSIALHSVTSNPTSPVPVDMGGLSGVDHTLTGSAEASDDEGECAAMSDDGGYTTETGSATGMDSGADTGSDVVSALSLPMDDQPTPSYSNTVPLASISEDGPKYRRKSIQVHLAVTDAAEDNDTSAALDNNRRLSLALSPRGKGTGRRSVSTPKRISHTGGAGALSAQGTPPTSRSPRRRASSAHTSASEEPSQAQNFLLKGTTQIPPAIKPGFGLARIAAKKTNGGGVERILDKYGAPLDPISSDPNALPVPGNPAGILAVDPRTVQFKAASIHRSLPLENGIGDNVPAGSPLAARVRRFTALLQASKHRQENTNNLLAQSKLKQFITTKPGKRSAKPKQWLIKVIRDLLQSKIQADYLAFDLSQITSSLDDFYLEVVTAKYGLKQLVDQHILSLLATVSQYKDRTPEISTFHDILLGLWPLDMQAFALHALALTERAPVGVMVPSDRDPSKSIHIDLIRATFVVHATLGIFGEGVAEEASRVAAAASVDVTETIPDSATRAQKTARPSIARRIDIFVFLHLLVMAYRGAMVRARRQAQELFDRVATSAHLTQAEFIAFLGLVLGEPAAHVPAIQLYEAALDAVREPGVSLDAALGALLASGLGLARLASVDIVDEAQDLTVLRIAKFHIDDLKPTIADIITHMSSNGQTAHANNLRDLLDRLDARLVSAANPWDVVREHVMFMSGVISAITGADPLRVSGSGAMAKLFRYRNVGTLDRDLLALRQALLGWLPVS
ncbi:Chromosome partition protein Smc [Carpediemonas membranifera]|uniref:Chromosome partition protein Smc n=1 Tax=Carpediemonas membranifera TaxID=201153 RepID=A0A8J6E2D0_9EUKA|nr:Chromosome partition protein Smc [Carpediemonas membranifera]|eukprot:KAG9397464.1 Chromosome partition protein Smc [Carpediemonas membranifera]